MELLHRALGICLLVTVLGQWLVVLAAIEGSSLIQPSPSVLGYGSVKNVTNSSKVLNTTAALILSSVSNVTVTPHNTTVIPRNTTVTPHNTTVTPHNTTVTPHNTTVTPSHNVTVTPHSSTVKPSTHTIFSPSRNMTVFPHNFTTIMPSSSSPTPPHSVTPTTPMPVPPTRGNFTLKDKMNKTCLFAYMAAKFDVTVNAKTLPSILLPENATISGACDNSSDDKPFITLKWQSKRSSYNFTLHFVKVRGEDLRDSSQRWAATNVTFFMEDQHKGSEAFHSQAAVLKKVSADVGDVFHCKAGMFKLIAVNSSVNVTLMDVDFQPFDVQNGELSKHVEDCIKPSTAPPPKPKPTKPEKESHTVAIAVGCTLAGLVVIIAIAYLIGRRRKRSSAGYRKL